MREGEVAGSRSATCDCATGIPGRGALKPLVAHETGGV